MASTEDKGQDRTLGTRVSNLFQLLEKTLGKSSKKQTVEDLQQIKYVTTKLHQIVTGQDKLHRDLILKQSSNVDILVATLQNTSDDQVIAGVVGILIELIGKTQVGKRASLLVNHGVTSVLFQILKMAAQDMTLADDIIMNIHMVLSRIGHKDRKFAVKARLNKVLLLTLSLIKSNSSSFRNLQCLLQVFKLYTNNSVNASYLGKHSSITVMFKVTSLCGRKHTAVLKLALDNLNNLTKSKSNSARTIGMGGVPTVLSLYTDWHQTDSKHRHINLRKAVLNILKNITNLKSGRKAFVESEGIRVLYETSQEVIDCREMESLILLASIIMRKCCPRNKLPIADVQSCVSYPLPASDFHIPECCLSDEQAFGTVPSQEESDHSSMDDDDDIDSDDERFRTDHSDEPDEEQGDGLEPMIQRSAEDLRMYDKFFPELFEYDFETPGGKPLSSVVIPTAASEPMFLSAYNNYQDIACRRVKSSSNISDSYGRTSHRPLGTSESDTAMSRISNHHPDVERDISFGRYGPFQANESATAVNVKTGASVFSLDLQIPNSNKPLPKSAQSSQRPSKKLKNSKKSQTTKEKKSKRSKAEPEFTEALSITPISTPHDYLEDNDRPMSSSSDDIDEYDLIYDPRIHSHLASATKSAFRFEKLAYPDVHGAKAMPLPENLYNRKFGVQRAKVFEDIDRMIHPDYVIDRAVFNMDVAVSDATRDSQENSNLANRDELRIGRQDMTSSALRFNSQFESGNLRKVIQVREYEYDLILNPDVNTNHHHQWFYFEVSNMVADMPYRFNIVNCEKLNSQFNSGMKPVMYSVTDAVEGRGFWKRVGTEICYYKNHFIRSGLTTGGVKGKSYYTATFTVKFKHSRDICYLAYHYPYTYTTLMTHLFQLEGQLDTRQIYYHNQTLCDTLGGNATPVLTITAQPHTLDREGIEEFRSRPYIFLSARVHPGESNASWIMKGTIDFLMSKSSHAQQLREKFIFKIVPMLNPDGVINGNHRCSLVAEDLNRRWQHPCPQLHPTIYHTKGLLQYLNMVSKTPLVYCDYHGHSRRKNIFLYGCSPSMSWIPSDTQNPATTGNRSEDNGFKALPRILHSACQSFSIQNCSFVVERAKETTARVVVWRQIGVVRSYTMESSYCGCDQGRYKDLHMNTKMLEEMGLKFCESLVRVLKTSSAFEQMPNLEHSMGGANQGTMASDDLGEDVMYDIDDDMKAEGQSVLDLDLNEDDSDEEAYQDDEEEENYYDGDAQ
ncbi:cytosolic carboxypeptidase 1-like [Haliotis cracherodii]|uniref:cytosolic carboxypeptidase 1-like n=1 Tax=Haliotis cracherodii TaxID=6455 RepID=UPI0039EA5B8A